MCRQVTSIVKKGRAHHGGSPGCRDRSAEVKDAEPFEHALRHRPRRIPEDRYFSAHAQALFGTLHVTFFSHLRPWFWTSSSQSLASEHQLLTLWYCAVLF